MDIIYGRQPLDKGKAIHVYEVQCPDLTTTIQQSTHNIMPFMNIHEEGPTPSMVVYVNYHVKTHEMLVHHEHIVGHDTNV